MKHYIKQIKFHTEAETAAKEMCDDKLARYHKGELKNYNQMQEQVKG